MGDGHSTSFWEHKWIGEKPLGQLFPILYLIDDGKEDIIAEKGSFNMGLGVEVKVQPICLGTAASTKLTLKMRVAPTRRVDLDDPFNGSRIGS